MEVGEFQVRAIGMDGLGNVGLGHADTEVIIKGSDSGLEEIVGYRG